MRSSRLAVVALASVLPAWCGDAPTVAPTVGIFLQFDNNNPGVAPFRVMEREVEQLLRPTGVALDWRLVSQNQGDEPFSKLIVLKFNGKCRVAAVGEVDPEPLPAGERTLAYTKLDEGHVLPFSQVQ